MYYVDAALLQFIALQLELSVDIELLVALSAPHHSSIVSLVDLTGVHLGFLRFCSVLYILAVVLVGVYSAACIVWLARVTITLGWLTTGLVLISPFLTLITGLVQPMRCCDACGMICFHKLYMGVAASSDSVVW